MWALASTVRAPCKVAILTCSASGTLSQYLLTRLTRLRFCHLSDQECDDGRSEGA